MGRSRGSGRVRRAGSGANSAARDDVSRRWYPPPSTTLAARRMRPHRDCGTRTSAALHSGAVRSSRTRSIDVAIDARRRPGLESPERKAEPRQRHRHPERRRFAEASLGTHLIAAERLTRPGTSPSRAPRSARAASGRHRAPRPPRPPPPMRPDPRPCRFDDREPRASAPAPHSPTRTYPGLSESVRSARTEGPFDSFRKSRVQRLSRRPRAPSRRRARRSHGPAAPSRCRRSTDCRQGCTTRAGSPVTRMRFGAEPGRGQRRFEARRGRRRPR